MYRIKVFVRYAEQGVLLCAADSTIKKTLETNSAVRGSGLENGIQKIDTFIGSLAHVGC